METKSKNNDFNKIENNMDKIKNLNDWEQKITLIKETRELIQKEKNKLNEYRTSIDNDLDDDIDFGKMDLEKVISKINKTDNLEKKIKNLKLLKLWIQQQKNKVIKN